MNGETATISINMDKALKEQAESLLSEQGINIASAVNLFLWQIVRQGKLPYGISLDGAFAPDMEARLELRDAFRAAQAQSVINGADTMTMEEIDAEIAAYRREKEKLAVQ